MVELGVKRLHADAKLPTKAHETDSGYDLYAVESEEIFGGCTKAVRTGISFSIPKGYEVQIRSKSGLALKKLLVVANSPGTIDEEYTGEIIVIVKSNAACLTVINRGDKIAQAVLAPVIQSKIVEIQELPETDRGANGFGSSGV